MVGAPRRRVAVRHLLKYYPISERRACQVVGQWRSVQRYVSIRPPDDFLKQRLRELARARVRYGYKRLHVLLRREGLEINHKRVHRIYCELGCSFGPSVPGATSAPLIAS